MVSAEEPKSVGNNNHHLIYAQASNDPTILHHVSPFQAYQVGNTNCQPATVVLQSVNMPHQAPPRDYLALSVINLIFCNFILGLIAIVLSMNVRKRFYANYVTRAFQLSKYVIIINIFSIILGAICWTVFTTLMIVKIVINTTKYQTASAG